MEGVLNMFSEELAILDRNTVRYMCEEMQEEINQQKKELDEVNAALDESKAALAEKDDEIIYLKKLLDEHNIKN